MAAEDGKVSSAVICRQMSVLYYDYGIRRFLCGVHRGTELFTLSEILKEKKSFPKLKVGSVFIHEEEASEWKEEERELLFHTVSLCDDELILKPVFGNEMRFQRNIVMMDLANMIWLLGRDREIEFWASKMMKPLLKMDKEGKQIIPPLSLYRKQISL